MPSPPGGYNSGSYPAPDQGNGISIYNSGAPQSAGSQGVDNQAPRYPQQLQPANGTQPPDYDAPLQPQEPQQPPRVSSAPQQQQQQPAVQPQQQQPSQPNDQREAQCEQIAQAMGIAESVFNVAGAGGSRSGGRVQPGRDAPGQGTGCACTSSSYSGGLMAGFVDSAGREVVTRGSLYVEWQIDGNVSKIKNLRLVFDDADVTSGQVISTLFNGFVGAPGGGTPVNQRQPVALEGLGLLGNTMQRGSSLGVKDLSRLSTRDDQQSWDHNHLLRINVKT